MVVIQPRLGWFTIEPGPKITRSRIRQQAPVKFSFLLVLGVRHFG
jgi:hypothetical protein